MTWESISNNVGISEESVEQTEADCSDESTSVQCLFCFSALSCMEVIHGHATNIKNADLPSSTWKVWEEYLTSPGRTRYPTTTSWNVLESQICTQCSYNSTLDGLDMFILWMMVEYLKTSCIVNWDHARGQLAICNYNTLMFVGETLHHWCQYLGS